MLGRLPDDAGLKAYCAELGSGLKAGKGLAELLTAISRSQEHWQRVLQQRAEDLVRAACEGILKRAPGERELKALAAQLRTSGSIAGLLSTVATSQEHWEQSLARRSQELVLALYRSTFNRDPDSQRLQSYATQLKANKDIPGLLSAIGASQEFWERQIAQRAEELVRAVYGALLNREPEDGALKAYVAQLKEHKSLAELLSAIGKSQEHWEVLSRERAPELVRTVFVALLNREPEEAALKAYAAQIQKGQGLNELLSAIARSQEHWGLLVNENAKELITAIHRGLLRREPDDIGLTKYLAQLNASGDLAAVASAIGRSRDAKLKSDAGWRHPARSYDATTWVFLHVEKTAGTSLRNMLTESFGVENIYQEHDDTLHLHCPAELSMFSVFAGHFNYDSVAYIPRRKLNLFTFVREPTQRLVSLYNFWRAHDPSAPEFHDSMRLARELNIETFYGCREIGRGQSTWNHMTWCIMGERQWRAWRRLMRRTVPEKRRHVIETLRGPIRQRLREFCFVGLQEDFAGSCRELFRIMKRACPEERADHSVERLADINLHIRKMAKPALTSSAIEVMSELVSIDTIVYEEALSLYAERFPDARHPVAPGRLVPAAGRRDGGANHSRERKARIRGR
jgi:TorA maturation chaperone TorD